MSNNDKGNRNPKGKKGGSDNFEKLVGLLAAGIKAQSQQKSQGKKGGKGKGGNGKKPQSPESPKKEGRKKEKAKSQSSPQGSPKASRKDGGGKSPRQDRKKKIDPTMAAIFTGDGLAKEHRKPGSLMDAAMPMDANLVVVSAIVSDAIIKGVKSSNVAMALLSFRTAACFACLHKSSQKFSHAFLQAFLVEPWPKVKQTFAATFLGDKPNLDPETVLEKAIVLARVGASNICVGKEDCAPHCANLMDRMVWRGKTTKVMAVDFRKETPYVQFMAAMAAPDCLPYAKEVVSMNKEALVNFLTTSVLECNRPTITGWVNSVVASAERDPTLSDKKDDMMISVLTNLVAQVEKIAEKVESLPANSSDDEDEEKEDDEESSEESDEDDDGEELIDPMTQEEVDNLAVMLASMEGGEGSRRLQEPFLDKRLAKTPYALSRWPFAKNGVLEPGTSFGNALEERYQQEFADSKPSSSSGGLKKGADLLSKALPTLGKLNAAGGKKGKRTEAA